LQHIQEVLIEPHKEKKIGAIKNEEKTIFPNKTKKEDFVKDHVNMPHQVLDEGIDNTFIFSNSLFLDEEKKDGSWGLDFDGNALKLRLKCRNSFDITRITRLPFSHTGLSLTAQTTSLSMKPSFWA
jgi:hypothetical protein